ncbi:MAG: hypothetical protein U0167_06925 [bacterium]
MRRILMVVAVLAATLPQPTRAATPTNGAAPAAPARAVPATVRAALPDQLDSTVFRCGPILAKDPAVRERIRVLYQEQWDLQQRTFAQLNDLRASAQSERERDALTALNQQGVQLKHDLLQRNMELGLEIARLNGDTPRVAEYEKALDQLLRPEKYMPAVKPDPELQARRLREHGITK